VYTIVDASQRNAQPTSLSNHHCPFAHTTLDPNAYFSLRQLKNHSQPTSNVCIRQAGHSFEMP